MPNSLIFRRIYRKKRLTISILYLLPLALIALGAPLIAPYDPFDIQGIPMQPPSNSHLIGTDEVGRDALSRIIYGARPSLFVSIGAMILAGVVGTIIGSWAGFLRGWSETILMQIINMMLSFPALLLAVTISAFLGRGLLHVIGVLGFVYVPHFARISHGSILAIRTTDYVVASRALGASNIYILRRHIIPNISAPLVVQASLTLAVAMRLEATLSFLGLGPPPPLPSWGRMISSSSKFLSIAPILVIAPAIILAITILAFNILGDGLRDVLDPKLTNNKIEE